MASSEKEPSDEEMRKLLKPNPSADQVVAALKKSYAESGQEVKIVKELESYDDKNFWVEINGTPFLAKVHNGVESKDFLKLWKEESAFNKSVIHLQNAIMEHLNNHGISSSKPQKPIVGDTPTPASVHPLPVVSAEHSPCELVVRLLAWVPGRTMESFKTLPLETLADAGRFLGKLSHTLSSLESDEFVAAKRYHQWDGKNTQDLKNFVDCIKDPRRRSMVESVVQAFTTDLIDSKVAEQFPKSLIHGDFNDANILLDDDCLVSGVIDFGDSVESWRVLDLSVAMAYAMLTVYGKKNCAISAAAAFLRGYNSVCPLTKEERQHLVLLIACRLSCSCTLGAYSYQQNPGNEYLLLHAIPAWNALDLIWGTDPVKRLKTTQLLNKVFDKACSARADADAEVFDCSDLSFPDPGVGDPLSEVRVVTGLSYTKSLSSNGMQVTKCDRKSVLTFCTSNPSKLEDALRLLGAGAQKAYDAFPFSIESLDCALDLPELQGDPYFVAEQKCLAAARQLNKPVFVEDTSLCMDALKGLPGPYIKEFLKNCGPEGLSKLLTAFEDKGACAQSIVVFCGGPKQTMHRFVGKTRGNIVYPRGKINPYKIDSIFEPVEGDGRTFAEMESAERDLLSHRSRAFSKFREFLIAYTF